MTPSEREDLVKIFADEDASSPYVTHAPFKFLAVDDCDVNCDGRGQCVENAVLATVKKVGALHRLSASSTLDVLVAEGQGRDRLVLVRLFGKYAEIAHNNARISNGDILAGYLGRGARNLLSQGKTGTELVTWLYRFALSRDPSPGERAVLFEVAGDGTKPLAIEDLLWILAMHPEFQLIY